MSVVPEEAFKGSQAILNQNYHRRLVMDIESVAKRANIPKHMIWTEMAQACGEEEIDYVKNLRSHAENDCFGLIYVGLKSAEGAPSVLERMSLMAAAMVRNYINAQVMNAVEIIHAVQEGTMPVPTVLLIPSFYTGGNIPRWQANYLLETLYDRKQKGLQTVLYISSEKELNANYGPHYKSHLQSFKRVGITN